MALVLKDRVKEQTTTTGTGTVTLGGAVSGFEAFSAVGDGNTTYYAIVHQTADEWEVGLGTYTAAGTLLSRDTILESTNSDAAVNFSAGTKDVFVTYPSDKAIYEDAAGGVDINGGTIDGTVIGGASAAAGTFTTGLFNTSLKIGTTGVNGDLALARSSDGATIATFKTDGTNGVINSVIDTVFQINTTEVGRIGTTGFSTANAAGPALLNEAATSTNPTIIPNKADPDTGMGWVSANVGALIAGGTKNISWDNTHVGLNGMTPNAPAQGNFSVTMGGIGSTGSGLLQIVGNAAGAYRNAGVHFVGYDGGSYSENAVIEQHYTTGTASGSLVFKTKAQAGSLTTALTLGDDQNATFTGNVSLSNAAGPALLNEAATGSNPTLIPNKAYPTNGIGANNSGTISIIPGGTESFRVTATALQGVAANAPIIKNETPTSTNPVFAPSAGDLDTGIGWVSANIGALVAGGAEALRWDSSGNVTTTGDMFIDRDGGTVAAWLNIDATNGYQTGVRLLTAGVKRWEIGTHEASAFEDFVLRSYNDAGGGVIETMYITRSNSQVAFVGNVVGTNAAGPTLLNEAATSTNPTLVPNKADPDTGVGWNSTNIGSLIAGGTEVASFAAAAFNITGAANVKQANNGNTGGLVLTRSDTSTYSSLYTGGGDSTILQFNGGRYIAITSTTGDTGGASSAGSGNQYVELLINGSRYKLLHDGTI
jgi:hypothetical protein